VEEISRGADMQRSRVESTAMAEMNSTVMEVAKNASQASAQLETTRKPAFKEEAVRLYFEGGRSYQQLTNELGQLFPVELRKKLAA